MFEKAAGARRVDTYSMQICWPCARP